MITKLETCPSCVQQMKLHSLSQFNSRLWIYCFFFPCAGSFKQQQIQLVNQSMEKPNQNLQNERNENPTFILRLPLQI